MKHIKNTWELFILDWKRIFKNPVATFLIVALMIIPSLYAWLTLKHYGIRIQIQESYQ